eukprot:scaffold2268_cov349-Prasinococcus_capsulatus_cf.AAC.9
MLVYQSRGVLSNILWKRRLVIVGSELRKKVFASPVIARLLYKVIQECQVWVHIDIFAAAVHRQASGAKILFVVCCAHHCPYLVGPLL